MCGSGVVSAISQEPSVVTFNCYCRSYAGEPYCGRNTLVMKVCDFFFMPNRGIHMTPPGLVSVSPGVIFSIFLKLMYSELEERLFYKWSIR